MSDAAFREALARYRAALLAKPIPEDAPDAKREEHRAEARVLALYAEASRGMAPEESAQYKAFLRSRFTPTERQGAVYEVQALEPGSFQLAIFDLDLHGFYPGDKVRVTKVEEGQ